MFHFKIPKSQETETALYGYYLTYTVSLDYDKNNTWPNDTALKQDFLLVALQSTADLCYPLNWEGAKATKWPISPDNRF